MNRSIASVIHSHSISSNQSKQCEDESLAVIRGPPRKDITIDRNAACDTAGNQCARSDRGDCRFY